MSASMSRHHRSFKEEIKSTPKNLMSKAHTNAMSEGVGVTPVSYGGIALSRTPSVNTPVSPRKQRFPQPKLVDDDEDDLSNFSDYDDDDMKPFSYNLASVRSTSSTGGGGKCDWCARIYTIGELTLATQDRVTKMFCSEDCQDSYKADILRKKICEWCRGHFPNKSSLIVVEPSAESVPLQFCTQSCINKYKMELFCVEVKEQLRRIKEDNVQLPIPSSKSLHSDRKILITPELWSEGESALVFINDHIGGELGNDSNNNSGTGSESSDRKRKGDSMETVISKLSRRHHRYTLRTPEEPIKPLSTLPPGNNQSTPINLTLQRMETADHSRIAREDNYRQQRITSNTAQHTDYSKPEQGEKLKLGTSRPWTGPAIIPIPILLPVPIPIPISVADISKSLANTQSQLTPRQQPLKTNRNHMVEVQTSRLEDSPINRAATLAENKRRSSHYGERKSIPNGKMIADDPE